jgi:hypothetical protein
MAVGLVDRLAVLVGVRCFPSLSVADSCSSRPKSYARMKDFIRRSRHFPFRRYILGVRRDCIV